MATMGRYCKAYPVERLRGFAGWTPNLQNLRPAGGQAEEDTRERAGELTDSDYLYLQENFTVTDGIFIDENVVFGEVTPEWVDFCRETLKFEAPV